MLSELQKAHKEFVAQVEKTQRSLNNFTKWMKDINDNFLGKNEDKECRTCGLLQCSQPTPDGQDICVDCGGNEDLIDIRLFDEPEYDAQFNSNQ